jgi:hypothetical protein
MATQFSEEFDEARRSQCARGMKSRNYSDLIAWQKGMTLAENVYLATSAMPLEERFGLTSQMRRAVVSIPANIAEGQGRPYG